MKRFLYVLAALAVTACAQTDDELYLSLVPPGLMTDKVELDIRAGVVNGSGAPENIHISIYLNEIGESSLLHSETLSLEAAQAGCARFTLPTVGLSGENRIIVTAGEEKEQMVRERSFKVMPSEKRSTELIEGAWIARR